MTLKKKKSGPRRKPIFVQHLEISGSKLNSFFRIINDALLYQSCVFEESILLDASSKIQSYKVKEESKTFLTFNLPLEVRL